MRKIETKEVIEKRSERTKLIVGVALVIIMVLSTAGYALLNISNGNEEQSPESEDKVNYRGLEFNLLGDNLWHFKIDNYEFQTAYNPLETEEINIPFNVSYEEYYGKPLYFVVSDESKIISSEIGKNIGYFPLRMNFACLEEKNCDEDLPLKNCADNLIIIKSGEANKKEIYRDVSWYI